MRLLVTGGCGFVGSNFVRYVLQHYAPEMITNVDALTTGRVANLDGVASTYGERYEFLHADLTEGEKMEAVMAKHQFFAVVHCAAEGCGVEATDSLLERARCHGIRRFLLVSCDRDDDLLRATEDRGLAAHREYGQEVVITRATENYGSSQSPSAFIPSTILHALSDEPVPVAAEGSRRRDWLHIEDHCAALFTALLDGQPGGVYHLKSGDEVADLDVAHQILTHLGKSRNLIYLHPAHPASAVAHTAAEAPAPLAWKPRHHLDRALRETIDWYVHNREWSEAWQGD